MNAAVAEFRRTATLFPWKAIGLTISVVMLAVTVATKMILINIHMTDITRPGSD